jgi:hypothetical protein
VHEEEDARLTIFALVLDQLVVRRSASEPSGQYLLQDADDVGI